MAVTSLNALPTFNKYFILTNYNLHAHIVILFQPHLLVILYGTLNVILYNILLHKYSMLLDHFLSETQRYGDKLKLVM
jgi:hypothetical protein